MDSQAKQALAQLRQQGLQQQELAKKEEMVSQIIKEMEADAMRVESMMKQDLQDMAKRELKDKQFEAGKQDYLNSLARNGIDVSLLEQRDAIKKQQKQKAGQEKQIINNDLRQQKLQKAASIITSVSK